MLMLNNSLRNAKRNSERETQAPNVIKKFIWFIKAFSHNVTYPQFTPTMLGSYLKIPPLGTVLLLLLYLGFVLALEFINNDVQGAQHYTALGIRASWLGIAQIPLLILLAGKNNLIGMVTRTSYERLNVLHRWVARTLLLLITLHFGYQSYGWNQYGLVQLEWSTDTCPPTGIAAYALLLWINLSTLAPLRHMSYEFFVLQHLITFWGFIIAVMFHLPSTALYSRVYIYIGIGLWFLDRLIRSARYVYRNYHPGRATLTAMEGDVTRVRVRVKQLSHWTPGSHIFLSIPRLGIGQSHPATIASIPSTHNNDLIFILKAHKGFTKRIMTSANSSLISLETLTTEQVPSKQFVAMIDGPYGGSHPDFAAFQTVLLISGSTGVTFTLPILLDIAHRGCSQKLPVRRLDFVWAVKQTSWVSWISDDLQSAFHDIQKAGIHVTINIFVTCDETVTDSSNIVPKRECHCDKSHAECCCNQLRDYGDVKERNLETVETTPNITSASPPANELMPDGRQGKMHDTIPYALRSGRPSFEPILRSLVEESGSRVGVAVCGPIGLSTDVRRTATKVGLEWAGRKAITLHAESFGW